MDWESFVQFHLGPLLQSQIRIGKFKSAYNSLLIGSRGLSCKINFLILWARNLLIRANVTLGPLLQGQTRIASVKSAYNLLIPGPRVLQC